MEYTEYKQALDFCGNVHKGQRRGNGDPYFFHCMRVSQIVAQLDLAGDMKLLRPKMIQIGLLHDCMEDSKRPDIVEKVMEQQFGSFVVSVVKEVTQDRSIPYEDRRKKMVDECGAKSVHAQIIKLADRLDNCSEVHGMSEKFIKRYLDETPQMIKNMNSGCDAYPSLKKRIEDIINPMIEARKNVEEAKP